MSKAELMEKLRETYRLPVIQAIRKQIELILQFNLKQRGLWYVKKENHKQNLRA